MKVILQANVDRLGQLGEVVNVADGYARNYLIPRGLAVPATKANMRQLDQIQAAAVRRADRELAAAKDAARAIEGQTVTIAAKAGEAGRLFGSVTAAQIAEQLVDVAGAPIDRRRVDLEEPIRQLGTHSITVRLHPEVKAEVEVEVIPEED